MVNQNPLVYIIIVSYNGRKNLEFSLPSLITQDYDNYRIFIADNNSTDDTEDWLKLHFPQVNLIKQLDNIGMGAMNDVLTWPQKNGFSEEPEYIFVAGWDLIFEPRTILHSVSVMKKDTSIGLLGYEVLGLFEWVDSKELDVKVMEWTHSSYYETNWVPGACSFYRKKLLDHIGFLDVTYFAYAEEDDLQFRVRQSGFKTVIINTFCWQDAGVGVIPKSKASFLYFRNNIRFHLKNYNFYQFIKISLIVLNTASNPFIKFDKSNRLNIRKRPFGIFANFVIWLRAFVWNIFHFNETLEAQRLTKNQIEKGRKYFNILNSLK